MDIIVCKFGGTSLADAKQFKKIKAIIKENPARKFVVASAPGKRFAKDIKVTDLFLSCYEKAVSDTDFEENLKRARERFEDIIRDLELEFNLDKEFDKLRNHLTNCPDKEYMASRGEYLNSMILASYLGFTFVDPEWCVCFNEDGTLNEAITKRTMSAALHPLSNAVIAGFYGADINGKIRTFSRGGSDITGSLVACAAAADLYENWTDVSGLLAADPSIVESPKSVEFLSYRELRTLSYMGARVLHTDAILPAAQRGIPINIRNTNRPNDNGTMIVRKLPKGEKRYPVTGVAGRKGMSVIQVEKVMVSDGSGFSAIMLDILKDRNLSFEQCLTGIDSITLVIRADLLNPCKEELLKEIEDTLNPDYIGLKENISMIAIVGEKGTESSDANVKVLEAIADKKIEISTINQGAGKLNLLVGVPDERYEEAIRAIYSAIEEN
ncbi:aspartate kinase [Acetitomaculum ruminis DSM 5522]|uniref:Aspartokinase n=1 Tax=Acetitomaculum ruminis DSM 5522 TaxID=1120918 RepID=A0A1I1A993_9FIRM|nr:aspartate kinase [Acetitomaculum ruminis]SFB34534.1 aspartate kinase [Acetitomaculum ruminis DSM 5522]